MISLLLSSKFSTEIFPTMVKICAPNAIPKMNKKNPPTALNPYQTFGLFLTVINLYKLVIKIPIPRKVSKPKNIAENAWSNVLVVAGLMPSVVS